MTDIIDELNGQSPIDRLWLNSVVAAIGLMTLVAVSDAHADQNIADQYPDSVLYSKPVEVIPGVWSSIGATAAPDYDNAGHNNNLSFIVTGAGVVVVNSGASYLLAKALHNEIKRITDEPVTLVINENGQGHAMLGNSYWVEQKVPVLAHQDAAKAFEENGYASLASLKRYAKENARKTTVQLPTQTFKDERTIEMGKFRIKVCWLGLAHSPGDIVVWLPDQRLVISGDMAFHERLLPVMEDTQTDAWLESWEQFESLGALYVIPGHGHFTNMDQVRLYTRDYLVYLRQKIRELLDEGGDLQAAYDIDQSPYAQLHVFDILAKQNAGRVFEKMEFE